MILALTYFEPPATSAATLPQLANDVPAQPAAQGDVPRRDPLGQASFDMIFSHSDAPAQALPAQPRTGQSVDAARQGQSEDGALDGSDTELMEPSEFQPAPEIIDPDTPQMTTQRSEGATRTERQEAEAPDTPTWAVPEKNKTPPVARESTVRPDDVQAPAPRSSVADQADTPKPPVDILPQAGRASEKVAEPGFSMADRGIIPPAATEGARPTPLANSDSAGEARPEPDKRPLRDGVWGDFAKRGERYTTTTPGFAAPTPTDGVISKPVQAASWPSPPAPASPVPAVLNGFVPVEDASQSRVGFQPDIGAVTDQRGFTEIVHTGRSDAPARNDLPRHVAAQLAEAAQRSGSADRPIELTLNPAELGRVRISMTPGDGTIVVTVLAERGETLDLMRRHADQLAQDFHDLGYGSAEFAFGQNSDGQGRAQGGAADGPGGGVVPSDTTASSDAAPRPIHLNADRVDIRL